MNFKKTNANCYVVEGSIENEVNLALDILNQIDPEKTFSDIQHDPFIREIVGRRICLSFIKKYPDIALKTRATIIMATHKETKYEFSINNLNHINKPLFSILE